MFEKIRDKAVEFYKSLTGKMKILLIGGIAATIIILTIIIIMVTKVDYVQIASGLDPAEAKIVTDKLDSLGIPWKDVGASTVFVPEKQVSKARMELAGAVNTGNITWEQLFNTDNITMTSNTRAQMIMQAQAGEIKKSIETINGVKSAYVTLRTPKESNFFMNDGPEATAAVVLHLQSNFNLDEEKIKGIVNLVASSAIDLKKENVTVLDQTGRQLNKPDLFGEFSASSQYDLKIKYEKKTAEDLKQFLTTVYGAYNVQVIASADLDFDTQVTSKKSYAPPVDGETTGMIRSVTRIKENVSSAEAIGAPGTDSNTGEATSVTEDEKTGSYVKASETLNYELNETFSEVKKAQGQIKELKISVLVNSKILENETLTTDHITELKELISNAVNTEVENVSLVAKEFADPMEQYDVYTGEKAGATVFGIGLIVALAAVILVAVIIIFVLIKKKKQREIEHEASLAAVEEEMSDYDEISSKEDKGSPKYHIEKFIDNNPEAAVTLLRAWLNEL